MLSVNAGVIFPFSSSSSSSSYHTGGTAMSTTIIVRVSCVDFSFFLFMIETGEEKLIGVSNNDVKQANLSLKMEPTIV